MDTFERLIAILTPIIMGALVVAKLYLELKKTQAERDAVIRGVDNYATGSPTGGYLKGKIKEAASEAGVQERVHAAVKRVGNGEG